MKCHSIHGNIDVYSRNVKVYHDSDMVGDLTFVHRPNFHRFHNPIDFNIGFQLPTGLSKLRLSAEVRHSDTVGEQIISVLANYVIGFLHQQDLHPSRENQGCFNISAAVIRSAGLYTKIFDKRSYSRTASSSEIFGIAWSSSSVSSS